MESKKLRFMMGLQGLGVPKIYGPFWGGLYSKNEIGPPGFGKLQFWEFPKGILSILYGNQSVASRLRFELVHA